MSLLITLSIILLSLIALYTLHFLALVELRKLMPYDKEHHHTIRSLIILLLLMGVHILEIGWFAATFYIGDQWLALGDFAASFSPSALSYFYQACTVYSTLGMTSGAPSGYLQLIVGVFSVVGFILLTWSATFFYALFSHPIRRD